MAQERIHWCVRGWDAGRVPFLRGSKGIWRAGLAQKLRSGLSPGPCSMLGAGGAPLLPMGGSDCPTPCGTPFLLDVCVPIDLSVSGICVCLCGMAKPGTALLLFKHMSPKILHQSDSFMAVVATPSRAPLRDVPSWFSTCTMLCAKPWGGTRPCWGHGSSCPIPTCSEHTVPQVPPCLHLPHTTNPFSLFQSRITPRSHWAEGSVRPCAFSPPPPCVNPSPTSRRLHPHPGTSRHALCTGSGLRHTDSIWKRDQFVFFLLGIWFLFPFKPTTSAAAARRLILPFKTSHEDFCKRTLGHPVQSRAHTAPG